jgi:hypothetical protein
MSEGSPQFGLGVVPSDTTDCYLLDKGYNEADAYPFLKRNYY